MEKVTDFDSFIANYIPQKPEYEAIYNEQGLVISISPKGMSDNISNKISIDDEIVEQIHAGNLHLHNCFVDMESGDLEIIRQEYLKKIDDIFHRIPEKKFVEKSISHDILVVFRKKSSKIKFSMSKTLKSKKIRWAGDTVLSFYVTDYNDPHRIIEKIEMTIDDLYKSDVSFDLAIGNRFSVFTRRILKNYVIEYKQ
jgi:hypothetical protein